MPTWNECQWCDLLDVGGSTIDNDEMVIDVVDVVVVNEVDDEGEPGEVKDDEVVIEGSTNSYEIFLVTVVVSLIPFLW